MLLYIVFVVAEIRNVLMNGEPLQPKPLTIWDEAPPPSSNGITLTYIL
jgi:hypothetical protein